MKISTFNKTVIALSLVGSSLVAGVNAQETNSENNQGASWRFLSLADWHWAEKHIMGERFKDYPASVDQNIDTLKLMKRDFGGDLIILPGDSNGGHWDTPKFIKKFNAKLTPKQSILQAGKLCYEGMIDTFERGGYPNLLMAVGDHEVGDNPWPVGSDVSKYQAEFRESFANAFNYTKDGSEFKFNEKIGSANSRPLGTKYQDTSYAHQHKNALFVTMDVFHQQDYQTSLGEQGTVTGTVVGPHLQWLESVLSEARKDSSIKHIFVQSHLPVIYPVRKVSSSGMLIDNGIDNPFWQLMRKYNVDIYFAGEVHANTVTKDPESDLLQVVTRGNFFTNFQTIDVSDDKIDMTLYRHYGEDTSDGNYREAGTLSVDKSESKTVIKATGELALLETKSKLLNFDFEQDFAEIDRPINGLSEKKSSYVIDGKRVNRTIANNGSFGSQYDALHHKVAIVASKNGNAGQFSQDSRMAVFAMGPLQGKHAVAYELSFKTDSKANQILINTATIWGNRARDFLNLYLDNGVATVAISDKKMLKADSNKLNDGKWHRIKVSMPHDNAKLSQLIIEIDGKIVSANQTGGDAPIKLNQSMRFTVGGKGYSSNALKTVPVKNFIGLIDDVSLWTL
ncbi:LamG domain-containing protein [Thalassotalea nanhaiensis]|uniref:LamG domain-containing protein n=1 Tax=Thalassotalea nanhaiensis TaxID=3065648 RepID=A0ABY9TLJ5_9GAMM|nr:LamG domain-containing protein [Colwelliaceae bacterium SQ345]